MDQKDTSNRRHTELELFKGGPRGRPHAGGFQNLAPQIALHPFMNLVISPALRNASQKSGNILTRHTLRVFPHVQVEAESAHTGFPTRSGPRCKLLSLEIS
eukprot:1042430-Pyramimonas_sp.AAC.2